MAASSAELAVGMDESAGAADGLLWATGIAGVDPGLVVGRSREQLARSRLLATIQNPCLMTVRTPTTIPLFPHQATVESSGPVGAIPPRRSSRPPGRLGGRGWTT